MAGSPGTVEFESAFGLAESVARLKDATRGSVFSNLAHETIVGRVSERRVRLQRTVPTMHNGFKPYFTGRFIERDGRIFLVGRFHRHWLVRVFMTLWFTVSAWIAVTSAALQWGSTHRHWGAVAGGGLMLVAGLALVGTGAWLSRMDRARIAGAIESTLSGPAHADRAAGT